MPSSDHDCRLPPSRPIDVHRWSDYPELNSCLTGLIAEIERAEVRGRARSSGSATRLRNAVRCIILDLYVAWLTDPSYEIGVSLGKDSFSQKTRYNALFLRYDTFHPAYSGLRTLGYILKVRPHFHDPKTGVGRVTRIRATPKLIELLTGAGRLTLADVRYRTGDDAREVIILRDEYKELADYRDNAATISMRSDLSRINDMLARHWIDLYRTDVDTDALNTRMRQRHLRDPMKPPYLDVTARELRRIFNNSDWQQGGRFYGGWWQTIPREYRIHITINGKHTVEVDYSGMHPALMYAEAQVRLDGDPYDIGLPHIKRGLIKRTFNALVNADGRIEAKDDFDEVECRLSWTELQERVKSRHKPIAQFLGTGHGVRLQNTDAKIANRIMLRFLDDGYVCLPVHDSFIVHHALKNELFDIMRDEFHTEAGAYIDAKAKFDVISGSAAREDTDVGSYIPMDAPFAITDEHAGYETRLSNWWANQG